jgi:DNA-binding Lrp family transcriptional regulator
MAGMDLVDQKILALVQGDGRMSVTELASKISLSISACSRRIHDLEHAGVIVGYRATVDPNKIGLGFWVLASITMAKEDADTVAAFERELAEVAEVHHAERLFGDPDYLVRVVTTDIEAYQQIRDTRLATLPGVQRITSTIVMRRVVDNRPLPTTTHT